MKPGIMNKAMAEEEMPPEEMGEEQPMPAGEQPAAEGANPQQPQYRSRVIEAIPQNMRPAFEKIVLAGLKVLYSPEMKDEIQKELDRDVPVWQKLGEGVAKLLVMLDQQSKKTMPQQLIIPAAVEIVADAADFIAQSGEEVSPDDLQKATAYVAICIAKIYRVPDDQIPRMFGQGQVAQQAQPAGA